MALGSPKLADDAALRSGTARAKAMTGELGRTLDDWLGQRTCEEAILALTNAGVPAGDVRSAGQVLADPQTRARDMIVRYPTAVDGVIGVAAASPIRIAPCVRPISGAPAPGQHTVKVLSELLHYPSTQIEALAVEGAVGVFPEAGDF